MSTTSLPSLPLPSSQPPQGQPPHVLYADDVSTLREVISLILQRDGYQISTVKDGAEALSCLRATPEKFGLLITDHHMPVMNGMELVRQLRTSGHQGKIMVFSSELDPAVHREYHRLGVQMILPKPVRPAMLREVLASLLPKSG